MLSLPQAANATLARSEWRDQRSRSSSRSWRECRTPPTQGKQDVMHKKSNFNTRFINVNCCELKKGGWTGRHHCLCRRAHAHHQGCANQHSHRRGAAVGSVGLVLEVLRLVLYVERADGEVPGPGDHRAVRGGGGRGQVPGHGHITCSCTGTRCASTLVRFKMLSAQKKLQSVLFSKARNCVKKAMEPKVTRFAMCYNGDQDSDGCVEKLLTKHAIFLNVCQRGCHARDISLRTSVDEVTGEGD